MRRKRRTIIVDGVAYEWRHGVTMTEVRRDGAVLCRVDTAALIGVTPEVHERGMRKRTSDCMVTPRMVAELIRSRTGRRAAGVVASFDAATWWGSVDCGDRAVEFHATCLAGASRRNLPAVGDRVEVIFSDASLARVTSLVRRDGTNTEEAR